MLTAWVGGSMAGSTRHGGVLLPGVYASLAVLLASDLVIDVSADC